MNSPAWISFCYASFGAATLLLGIGLWHLPADNWIRGYVAIATVWLVTATVNLAKVLRDEFEFERRQGPARAGGAEPLKLAKEAA